ncbi:DUF2512 family protein [Desulfolucanica intricata]|uniref:DUF2512 family protein n=1 Tax=Desulfolucanica intricata TaxID=1285191 RepID=UPI0008315934|nr:DUF2512 family protein [Desulfolucanica intricata]
MKKHFNLLITKFLLIAPVLGFIGQIFSNMDIKTAILTAGIITLGTYLSGDLVLLLQYGTKTALAGEAVITTAIYWKMSNITEGAIISFPGILFATALIVLGEWYYHPYLLKNLSKRPRITAKNITAASTKSKNKTKSKSKNHKKRKQSHK